ncbi:MAG: YDG domain-containing protein [Anaerolineae bacterium]
MIRNFRSRLVFVMMIIVVLTAMLVTSASADSSGPRNAGTGSNVNGPGSVNWTNPGNVTADDTNYATANLGASATSEYLQATNYGFNIPASATIDGIQVAIMRQSSSALGNNSVDDSDLYLLKGGAIVGTDHAVTTDWPTSFTEATYGATNDLWGTTWTAAEINATNFGVALSVLNESGLTNRTASVDYIQVTVTYRVNTTTSVDCGSGTPTVTYGSSITCVATVTRGGGSNTPAGNVSWTTSGAGSFVTSPCTLSGSGASATCSVTYTPSSVGSGTHTITATYAGNTNFTTSNGNQGVTVNPKALTITGITANNKVYDGITAATISGTPSLVGVVGTDVVNITGTPTATFANKQVGTGKTVNVTGYSLGGTNANNYTLTQPILSANITARAITVTAASDSKTYDGTTGSTGVPTLTAGTLAAGDSATWSQTFDDENVGTGKSLTPAGSVSDGNGGNNYLVTFVNDTTGVITAQGLTVSGVTANNKVYDGNTTATVNFSGATLVGVVGSDDVTLDTSGATGTFSDKNVGSGKTVTVSGLALTGTDAGNYSLTQPITTADITAAALIVSGITANNKVYDGNTTATLDTTGAALIGAVLGDDVTLDTSGATGAFSDTNVDPAKTVAISGLTLDGSDAGNYTLTQPTTTADITAATLTVTANDDSKSYDGVAYSGGNGVSYAGFVAGEDETDLSGALTYSGSSQGAVNAGLYLITPGGLTSTNYAITFVDGDLTVDPRDLTVTATGINKVYDGTTAADVTLASDALPGDDVTPAYTSAAFVDKNIGTGKTVNVSGISISGADAGNYTVNTSATTTADITVRAITVTAASDSKTYDGTTGSTGVPTLTAGTLAAGDSATWSQSFDDENVGTGKSLTPAGSVSDGNGGNNYLVTFVNDATGVITARAITVTAASDSKTYDGTTGSTGVPTLTAGTLAVGDNATWSQSFDDENVGTGKSLTPAGSVSDGNGGNNYSVTFVNDTTGVITAQGLTVSGVTADNKVYDGNTTATVNFSGATLVGVVGSDDVTLDTSGATGTFSDKNVGSGKTVTVSGLTLTGTDAGNYSLAQPTATADITTRALTVTASGINKVYDGTTNAMANLSDDRVSGDIFSASYTSATFDDKNVGTGKTINISDISISGADAGNYTVNTSATATADITALALTGSITVDNKVYDGTTAATIASRTLIGVIGGDTVSYIGGTATFADKNVGNGKTVTAVGLSLSGADAGNYTVNTSATTTADITARDLTVTATGINKVYDGTTSATVTLSTNTLPGDDVTPAYTSAAFADENVGTAITVNISGISISGADAGNYNLLNTSATTTADITARAITVTAASDSKTYDGTTDSTGVPTLTAGTLAAGDSATWSQSFDDENVGTGKSLTPAGSVSDGNGGNNYSVTFVNDATGVITAKNLTISGVTADNKVYNGTTAATLSGTALLNGVESGDTVNLGGTPTATFVNANVGNNKVVTVTGYTISGADAANYTLTQPTGLSANITPKPITVTANSGQSKVYGATDPVFTYTFTPTLETGDSFTGALSRVAGENVGPYAITQGTLSAGSNYSLTFVPANFTITPASTTVSLASSENPSIVGSSVTFTATVTPASASGTVQFYADGVALGSAVTLSGGTANVSTAALIVGTHAITATYSGSGNFNTSTSASLEQTVGAATEESHKIYLPLIVRQPTVGINQTQ